VIASIKEHSETLCQDALLDPVRVVMPCLLLSVATLQITLKLNNLKQQTFISHSFCGSGIQVQFIWIQNLLESCHWSVDYGCNNLKPQLGKDLLPSSYWSFWQDYVTQFLSRCSSEPSFSFLPYGFAHRTEHNMASGFIRVSQKDWAWQETQIFLKPNLGRDSPLLS
jgi:hypothetical protein